MATYLELRNLWADADLRNRLQVAVTVVADEIFEDPAQEFVSGEGVLDPNNVDDAKQIAARKAWAVLAITTPRDVARPALRLVLANRKGADVATIQALGDNALATQVERQLDILAQVQTPQE